VRIVKSALAAAALFALVAVANNQLITRGYIYSNIGTLYTWSGSSQPSWSGSAQIATQDEFCTYIANNGCAGKVLNKALDYGTAAGWAVSGTVHSPLLANNTFTGGSFTSWTNGACFAAASASDQDGDSGYARGSGGASPGCTANMSQTFTVSGAPAAQSYSLWYAWAPVQYGDPYECTLGTGNASNLKIIVNGTTVATVAAPTGDSVWHQVAGSMSALVNGSNTLTVQVTLVGATGRNYNAATGLCTASSTTPQTFNVDNIVLQGTF
jgi:hypothetical protein